MRRFDQECYGAFNAACGDVVRRPVPQFKERLSLKTALHLGCGLGYFADLRKGVGLKVLAIDGRAKNVEQARARYPDVSFQVADTADPNFSSPAGYG